jgi:hypothetical protein
MDGEEREEKGTIAVVLEKLEETNEPDIILPIIKFVVNVNYII